jgi:hypothetical protein
MKKNYVTPEMDEFKFEMPQLFDGEGMGGSGEAETSSESAGGPGEEGDDAA